MSAVIQEVISGVAKVVEESSSTRLTSSTETEDSDVSDHLSSESCESLNSAKFNDGVRTIDMVLVYKDDGDPIGAEKRSAFEANLRFDGLQIEKAEGTKNDSHLVFVKIHAGNHVLAQYADIHDTKVTFSEIEESKADYPKLLGMMSTSPGFRTIRATFREEDIEGKIANEGSVFTNCERSSMVYSMLRRTRYGEEVNAVGLPRLLTERVYVDAFPLHDGKYDVAPPPELTPNDRRILYTDWARPLAFYRKQPIDLINKYFGDEVALYFAWMGCYTAMLVPATAMGVFVMIVGIGFAASDQDETSREICSSDVVLCPRCGMSYCQEYVALLSESCTGSRFAFLMDNYATIVNAFCMAFWATAFGEVWKRQLTILQWRWDLQSEEIDYDLRPEFLEKVKTMRYNPILKKMVPYVPWWSLLLRMGISTVVVVFMMLLSVFTFIFILVFKLIIKAYMEEEKWNEHLSQLIMILCGPLLSVTLMAILGTTFQPLASILTDLEMPRTQSAYEKSRAFKLFAFSFVNSYILLIYLAFLKGKFYTYPGDPRQRALNGILDLGNAQCDPSGCILEVVIQLFVTLIVKQGFANITEMLKPQIFIWWRQWKWRRNNPVWQSTGRVPRWEEEYQLRPVTIFTLSYEVQEMVIQYGFTILFVAVFPLAPLFALLSNVAEIRVDASKMLVQSRRAVARKVSDLGAWEGLMKFMTFVAVLTNALLIAFTSHSIPETLHMLSDERDKREYIHEMFSYFPVAELTEFRRALATVRGHENDTYCRYQGLRMPPWDDAPYTFRYNHWKYLSFKLGLVVFFVSIVLAVTAIFSYLFPDIPWIVKEQMLFEKDEAIKAKKNQQRERESLSKSPPPKPPPKPAPKTSSIVSERRATPYFSDEWGLLLSQSIAMGMDSTERLRASKEYAQANNASLSSELSKRADGTESPNEPSSESSVASESNVDENAELQNARSRPDDSERVPRSLSVPSERDAPKTQENPRHNEDEPPSSGSLNRAEASELDVPKPPVQQNPSGSLPQAKVSKPDIPKPPVQRNPSSGSLPRAKASEPDVPKPPVQRNPFSGSLPRAKASEPDVPKPPVQRNPSSGSLPRANSNKPDVPKPPVQQNPSSGSLPQAKASEPDITKPPVQRNPSSGSLSRAKPSEPDVLKLPPPRTGNPQTDNLNSPSRINRRNAFFSNLTGEQEQPPPPQPSNPFLARWV